MSDDGRFHDIAHAVTEAYSPDGQAIWWRAWAMHPDRRDRMEAGMLAAWSGEPTDDIEPSDDEREAATERMGRVMGWQFLVRYSGRSPEWMASTLDALASAACRQGPVSVSREQVDRAALDAARAVRGVTAHLRDADRLHVTAALHALGITVAD